MSQFPFRDQLRIHLLTPTPHSVLYRPLNRPLPILSLASETLPLRRWHLREHTKLQYSLPFVQWRHGFDRAFTSSAKASGLILPQGRETYFPQVLQKNLPNAAPLNVFVSVYSCKFSSPSIVNFSFSIVRLCEAAIEKLRRQHLPYNHLRNASFTWIESKRHERCERVEAMYQHQKSSCN